MTVRAKSAATLVTITLVGGAFGQENPASPAQRYTEVTSEQLPLTPSSAGTRVQAVQWTQFENHAVGLAVGVQPSSGGYAGVPQLNPGVGVRWRSRVGDRQRLDVTTWRHFESERDTLAPAIDDATPAPLTTRIEMQFVPPQSKGFGAELGAVGLQLSSDTKLQLRIRRGGPMLYYRSRF